MRWPTGRNTVRTDYSPSATLRNRRPFFGAGPKGSASARHEGLILNGNATFRHHNVALLAVNRVQAPVVLSSAEFDERLAPSLKRLRLSKKLLERASGVKERRWWSEGTGFDDAAVEAGGKALAEAGIEPGQIGLLINTSVTRRNLEPSVASKIHHDLGLPSSAMNFDVANACLGFVNGMSLAANMIDSGQIKYALIVAGEDAQPTQETTFQRLNAENSTREDYLREFATLTLGSGAAAAVVGPADEHPGGHRIVGGVSRAGTQHHELCVGGPAGMYTDTKGLLDNGLDLVVNAWQEAHQSGWDWRSMDRYVTHQVSKSYTNAIIKAVGLIRDRVPVTFPKWGNVGPASLPMTLSQEAETLKPGDRVLCMGVGSGLNTTMMELAW
ncbi:3-oxoacyl-ACP synthase III [Glutamicibacter sp. V16R2B1]|nr:3-oxoacyl-ACP synthase III [Glutamicibacter sp. V16R2B1]